MPSAEAIGGASWPAVTIVVTWRVLDGAGELVYMNLVRLSDVDMAVPDNPTTGSVALDF